MFLQKQFQGIFEDLVVAPIFLISHFQSTLLIFYGGLLNTWRYSLFFSFVQTNFFQTRLRTSAVVSEKPLSFVYDLYKQTAIEPKTLRYNLVLIFYLFLGFVRHVCLP